MSDRGIGRGGFVSPSGSEQETVMRQPQAANVCLPDRKGEAKTSPSGQETAMGQLCLQGLTQDGCRALQTGFLI